MQGAGFRVKGVGCRVQGVGFCRKVPGDNASASNVVSSTKKSAPLDPGAASPSWGLAKWTMCVSPVV